MKFSKNGYKRNSKDRNNPYNIIPSGNITMEGVDFPVFGMDNLGHSRVMMPGANYTFPGNTVFEIPLVQNGIEVPKRKGVRLNYNEKGDVVGESTHLMRAEQLEDGNWVAFPSLFQNEDEEWVDMSGEEDWMKIYQEAVKRGEVINFGDNKDAAIAFGEGSWKNPERYEDRIMMEQTLPEVEVIGYNRYGGGLLKVQDGNGEDQEPKFTINEAGAIDTTGIDYTPEEIYDFIIQNYDKIDTAKEKQYLLNKLQSQPFRDRYAKQILNLTGEQLSEDELTERINAQYDFTAAGPDFHVMFPYVTRGPFKPHKWADDPRGFQKRYDATPMINPFDSRESSLKSVYGLPAGIEEHMGYSGIYFPGNYYKNRTRYNFETDEYESSFNPAIPELAQYPYSVQLAAEKRLGWSENIPGESVLLKDEWRDTVDHEYAHSYNTEWSPLFKPVADLYKDPDGWYRAGPGKEYKKWLVNLFGEDYFDKDKNRYGKWAMQPEEISSIKAENEAALFDLGIWDNTKEKFGEKHLNKMLNQHPILPGGASSIQLSAIGYGDLKYKKGDLDDINKEYERKLNEYKYYDDDIVRYIENQTTPYEGRYGDYEDPFISQDTFNNIFNQSQKDLKERQRYSSYDDLLEDYYGKNKRKKERATTILNSIYGSFKTEIDNFYQPQIKEQEQKFEEKKKEVLPKMEMYFNEIAMDDQTGGDMMARYGAELPKAQGGMDIKFDLYNAAKLREQGYDITYDDLRGRSKNKTSTPLVFPIPNAPTGDMLDTDFLDNPTDDDINQQNYDNALWFATQWMRSPRYKEMLLNSGGTDWWTNAYDVAQDRINNLTALPEDVYYFEDDFWQNFSDEELKGIGGYSKSATGNIYVSPIHAHNMDTVMDHEVSHSIDRPIQNYLLNPWRGAKVILRGLGNEPRLIPEKDVELIGDLAKNKTIPENQHVAFWDDYGDTPEEGTRNYFANPTEVRARLNEMRKRLYTEGVDVFNKEITSKDIKRISESKPFTDLQNIYDDEDILKLINTISQNQNIGDDQDITDEGINFDELARYGIELPKAQTGFDLMQDHQIANQLGVSVDELRGNKNLTYDDVELGASFLPYVGEAIDAKNTIKSLYEGNYLDAGLNAAGFLIPFVPGKALVKGWKKLFGKSDEVVDATKKVAKTTDDVVTTPKWSRGVTHYGDAGPEGIQNALAGMKSQGKYLDDMNFDASTLIGKNIVHHGPHHGRQVVEVALPNGRTQLFYKSSGLAGKSGKGVAGTTEGLWQPYGGHAKTSRTDNWFIKDAGYEDYYGSKSFKDIADQLDRIALEEGWDMSGQLLKSNYKKQDGGEQISFDDLEKGIRYAESLNGELMINPESTATGLYGQLWSEIKDKYDGTREEFAEDLDYQKKIFKDRANGLIEGVPGLIKNGIDLYDEYSEVEHGMSMLEIAALSNMLGRQGTRKYIGNHIRDGKSLADVFPHLYGDDVNQTNKTPIEYIEKFNKGLLGTKLGGEIGKKLRRLKQQLKLYNEGQEISGIVRKELMDRGLIQPVVMKEGGSLEPYTIKQGDYLGRIARDRGLSVDEIIAFNPKFKNRRSTIYPGEVVYFDEKSKDIAESNEPVLKYTIQKGDTLGEIATTHNVSLAEIAELNNLTGDQINRIYPGHQLIMPKHAEYIKNESTERQDKIAKSPVTTEDSIVINEFNPMNEVWVTRERNEDGTYSTVGGKKQRVDEINLYDNYETIINAKNDGDVSSSTETYTVKQGDTLSAIAADRDGVTVNSIAYNNNIDNPNNIIVGQKLKITKTASKPYLVVDKQKGKMHLLYPGEDAPRESYDVLLGTMIGDQATKTVTTYSYNGKELSQDELNEHMKNNGVKTIPELLKVPGYRQASFDQYGGNRMTGAGKYTISAANADGGRNYRGDSKGALVPSFNLVSDAGVEQALAIHGVTSGRVSNLYDGIGTNNRLTTGCINGKCVDLQSLYNNPDIGEGTEVYILPEKEGSSFVYENGKLNFYTSRENQKSAEEGYFKTVKNQKRFEGKGGDEGEFVKGGPGINVTTDYGNYRPIQFEFDIDSYKNSDIADGSQNNLNAEYQQNTKPFLNALAKHKKPLMDLLNIDGDLYNNIALTAFGIYGNESGMGDINNPVEDALAASRKAIMRSFSDGEYGAGSVEGKYNYAFRPDQSVGWTQLRVGYGFTDPRERELLAELDKKFKTNFTIKLDGSNGGYDDVRNHPDYNTLSKEDKEKAESNNYRGGIYVPRDKNGMPIKGMSTQYHIYKIDNSELMDQEKSALATMVILTNRYQTQIPNKEKNAPGFDIFNRLPLTWRPTGDKQTRQNYVNLVNKNMQFVKLIESDIEDFDDNVITKGSFNTFYVPAAFPVGPKFKRGGEFGLDKQVQFYEDYVNDLYKNTNQEKSANKLYDKLNRMYYNDSKQMGRNTLDVMRAMNEQSNN